MVALEERLLQVRSREIRLEKETGRLQEALEQAGKQLHASRHDRASLQATIDILQVSRICTRRYQTPPLACCLGSLLCVVSAAAGTRVSAHLYTQQSS